MINAVHEIRNRRCILDWFPTTGVFEPRTPSLKRKGQHLQTINSNTRETTQLSSCFQLFIPLKLMHHQIKPSLLLEIKLSCPNLIREMIWAFHKDCLHSKEVVFWFTSNLFVKPKSGLVKCQWHLFTKFYIYLFTTKMPWLQSYK